MDEHGVTAQILYPNLVAFEGHTIMALPDDGLKFAIFEAYNDFLAEFTQRAPGRFIPLAALPFWDIDASIREMRRCASKGHRGVLWAATLDKHNLPSTTNPYWDPFYAEAQELGMSINFHVGVGWTEEEFAEMSGRNEEFNMGAHVGRTARSWMSNAKMISDLIMDGVCERFPRLDFVSVESGFGWVPFLLDGLDWQWRSMNGPAVHGGLLPSEYFKRQIYTMFWFEESSLCMMDLFPDSIMFETDFPHTTSLSPGPGSASPSPRAIIERARSVLSPETFQKVMYGNAARVYHLDQ
jgi:predicted TIM-barrel fold metal-dependent hydrolase